MLRRPLAVLTIALAAPNPAAAAEPFHIVTIENAAGTEVRQADKGFRLGLDYATKGSLSAGGYALDVTVLDDRGDPALAASLLANGLRDSRADIAVSLDAAPGPELTRVAADLDHVLLLA
ncbi:MAG TPA: hypothetical protein VKU84_15220, partial [Stellaceae bacterium]|nr:hypothetical protein [Stellaceae bacterium]